MHLVCNSWPKSGTHVLLELARLVLGHGPWYDERDLKYPNGEDELIRQLRERRAAHGDNFAVKGHFERSAAIEREFRDGGWKHLFVVRDPREVLCSTWRWLKDLRQHWGTSQEIMRLDPKAQIQRVITGLPLAYPLSHDAAVAWDRPLPERYAKLTAWLDAPDCCVMRYEEITGRAGARRQREVLERTLHFLGCTDRETLARVVAEICNPQSLTFHTGPASDWETTLDDEARRLFVETGGEELVERLGYLPTRYAGRPLAVRGSRLFLERHVAATPLDPHTVEETLTPLHPMLPPGPISIVHPHGTAPAAEDSMPPATLVSFLDGGWESKPGARDLARAMTALGAACTTVVVELPDPATAEDQAGIVRRLVHALAQADLLARDTLVELPRSRGAARRLALVAERRGDLLQRAAHAASSRPVVVFGTGRAGYLAARVLEKSATVLAFADNDARRWGGTMLGRPIAAPETVAMLKGVDFILASMHGAAMKRQLVALGVPASRIRTLDTELDRLVIFGTGQGGEQAWSCISDPAQVIAFADNNEARRVSPFHGRSVLAPAALPALQPRAILLASMHAAAMREQLLALGFSEAQIVNLDVPLPASFVRPVDDEPIGR